MRYLIACPACRRQLDVSGRSAGERFSCSCGTSLEVGRPSAHDAAVIRCSSCGAPREESAEACRFCGAEFTLHARDLDTLCSGCMARVSGKARFCHSCGSPVLVAQAAIAGTLRTLDAPNGLGRSPGASVFGGFLGGVLRGLFDK